MNISKTQRWLDLIAFLVKRRFPVAVEDLMEGVPAYAEKWRTEDDTKRASVRRMFERDKDELRRAGIPLETVPYTIDYGAEEVLGYQLATKDFYLPYLRLVGEGTGAGSPGTGGGPDSARERALLGGQGSGAAGRARAPSGVLEVQVTPEEATLVLDALHRVADLPESPFADEARAALLKLRFDLEGEGAPDAVRSVQSALVREAAPLGAEPVLFADDADSGVRDALRVLTAALRDRKRVRFRYHGIHRGQSTDRDVAPYGLMFQHGQWYLVGHDATRDAVRVFRLGRMEALDVSGGTSPEFQHDPAFRLDDYTGRSPWELGEDDPLDADVRFEFPLSLWAERNGHGRLVEELPGGATVRRFAVRQTGPFLRWLQSCAGDAVVVHPPALRKAQAALARETAALHAGAEGGHHA